MTARFSGACDEKRAVTDRAYSLASAFVGQTESLPGNQESMVKREDNASAARKTPSENAAMIAAISRILPSIRSKNLAGHLILPTGELQKRLVLMADEFDHLRAVCDDPLVDSDGKGPGIRLRIVDS